MAGRLSHAASRIMGGTGVVSRSVASSLRTRAGMGLPVGKHIIPDQPLPENDELVWDNGTPFPEPCIDRIAETVGKYEALAWLCGGLSCFGLLGLATLVNDKPSKIPFDEPDVLSAEAKDAATCIDRRLQLGCKLSDVINTKMDAAALFDLYGNEGYLLTEHGGRFFVILKESCSPQDMLKSMFQVSYLYWLEKNLGLKSVSPYEDCRPGGKLQMSLEYVQREFNHAKIDSEQAGWTTDGLIARPLPYRIRPSTLSPAASC